VATATHGLGNAEYDRSFFGHPRGLSTLFFTEMWERFSYYGMRALLILFMTATIEAGGLGFDAATAGAIYAMYTAMVYMMALPGGWIADRLIGQRRAVLYGGILIASGHFSMAFPSMGTFYMGLVLIVLGTGLLKPNISVIVGQLYGQTDQRRDAGFTISHAHPPPCWSNNLCV
jgi:POT family proton-dependent oligopeptide transporter